MKKKIHIFKTGTHTPVTGGAIQFSDSVVKSIATNYNPEKYEAPIVIGHPKMEAPAFGWVSGVEFSDGNLFADVGLINSDFADAVNKGYYKKVSASFFTPNSPNNPTPGEYHLRHVGFLGAASPAVKGLENATFSDKPVSFSDDDEIVTVEFSENSAWGFKSIAQIFKSIREYLIEDKGKDVADVVIPTYQIESLENIAQDENTPAAHNPAFADPTNPNPTPTPDLKDNDMPEQATIDLDKAKQELEAKEATHAKVVAEFTQKQNLADAKTFIKDLGGKVLPSETDGLASFMASLSDDTISFGDTADQPTMEFFKNFLNGLPDRVNFTEVTSENTSAATVSFAAPAGTAVNQDKLQLDADARALQSQNPGMKYLDAVAQASNG